MPKGYHHLAYDKRCQIYALLNRGFSQIQIADDIEVAQSTVSRELKRNKGKRGYRHKQAQERSTERRYRASAWPRKMRPEVTQFIEQAHREKQWSPEQISGYVKRNMNISISHESIYQYILNDKRMNGTLYKHLRRSGKKYNRRKNKTAGRGLIPNRVGIENRPAIVELKERVGDFEMDTIIGSHHRGAIVSVVDRRTKLTRLELISRTTAEETGNAVVRILSPIKKNVLTLTADNGKEFAGHRNIAKALNATVYFANPYHAWERGLNENTNGLVRQYFPKKTDFSKLTRERVRDVEYLLNTRPRKNLQYQTPIEVFLQLTGHSLNYALQI
jgi:IS30 family transposase